VDPSTSTFSFFVLYDAMLNQPVAIYDKRDLQFKPKDKRSALRGRTSGTKLFWRDLHKKPLVLPTGAMPYRTALLWIARRAFERAQKSGRTLVPLTIGEEDWSIMFGCLVDSHQTSHVMKKWLATK
jgi:hypothetical protein